MFDVHKPVQKPIVVIRAASGHELSAYEKRKLAGIEEHAQENTVEIISINGERQYLDPVNKEVKIELGNLAAKDKVTPVEISTEELFFIKCELDDASEEANANE